jgi:hypothetical protein
MLKALPLLSEKEELKKIGGEIKEKSGTTAVTKKGRRV